MIDVDHPDRSKLLEFIRRHSSDSNELQNRVRRAELEAFESWIQASVRDPASLSKTLPPMDDLAIDRDLVRHVREDKITERFIVAIWSQLERCANCHSPDRNAKQVEKKWRANELIVPQSPRGTLQALLEKKLIDLDTPSKSVLRLKAIGQDSHGGGVKFPDGGQTDQAWLAFLEDYRRTVQGDYQSSKELPKPSTLQAWRIGMHLRINQFPKEWADRLLVIHFYRMLEDGSFSDKPVAMAESRFRPKN